MILSAIAVTLPVFFVLALGCFAGRARKFDPDQLAGLNELVLDYALPAAFRPVLQQSIGGHRDMRL